MRLANEEKSQKTQSGIMKEREITNGRKKESKEVKKRTKKERKNTRLGAFSNAPRERAFVPQFNSSHLPFTCARTAHAQQNAASQRSAHYVA
jgi:hypothetical protein